MIHQKIFIEKYDWDVSAYFAVSCYHADEIAEEMKRIGCRRDDIERSWRNMQCGNINNGITYSNSRSRKSVCVIGLASKPSQFLNSLTHEIFHLTIHICKEDGINLESEEAAYLAGDIAEVMHEKAARLLCGCFMKHRNHSH